MIVGIIGFFILQRRQIRQRRQSVQLIELQQFIGST
jgi:hypothetical protein